MKEVKLCYDFHGRSIKAIVDEENDLIRLVHYNDEETCSIPLRFEELLRLVNNLMALLYTIKPKL